MKCISLYNPHALMLSLSIKKTETRKRRTHYRGPLAIHATQTTPRAWFEKSLEIPAVKDVLRTNTMGVIGAVAWIATRGQGGLVVATCELVDCVEITADNAPWLDDEPSTVDLAGRRPLTREQLVAAVDAWFARKDAAASEVTT